MLRSSWSPAAVFLVLLMAAGSVVMWIGVPLGLIYLASRIADSSAPSLGPYLLVFIGLPVGMALIGKRLPGPRAQPAHRPRGRQAPVGGLAALDARRPDVHAPRRRAGQGDDHLGHLRRHPVRDLVLRLRGLLAADELTFRGRRPGRRAESRSCT
jgi:hypothetical protein